MARRSLFSLLVILLVLGMVLALGCTKRSVYQGPGGSVSVEEKGKKSKVTVKTGKGQAEIETGAALPKNWPQDMPVYKGAKITGSASIKGEQATGTLSLALESSDSVAQVQKFYETGLPGEGWNITMSTTTADHGEEGSIVTVTKDKRTGIITITRPKGKDKTQLVIQIFVK